MSEANSKTQLFDSVRARFGGRDLTFKIAREDLDAFETYAGESAFRMFRLLTTALLLGFPPGRQ